MKCSHSKFHKWIPLLVLLGIGLAFLAGWVIQLLWNATITEIFHSQPITYWQGVMLLILSKLFFGLKADSHHHSKVRSKVRKIHCDNDPEITDDQIDQ